MKTPPPQTSEEIRRGAICLQKRGVMKLHSRGAPSGPSGDSLKSINN